MARPPYTDEQLIDGYLASIAEGGGHTPHFWAYEEVTQLIGTDPERAWRLTVEMVRQGEDVTALATVAAGPLEDLLCHNGPQFIDRAVALASLNARFRDALSMIYVNRLKEEVGIRVLQAIAADA